MLKPPINELLSMVDSRYSLVIAVSKRARQIVDGERVLSDVVSTKPVTIATNEFYEGKVITLAADEVKTTENNEENAKPVELEI